MYSSGPGLVLEFHSGPHSVNATGFSGTFRFIDKKSYRTDGMKLPNTMCDYQFLSSNHQPSYGKFYSPRYPSNYPRNIRCSYRFRARFGETVTVMFEELQLQKGDISCLNRADIVRVYDGKSSDDPAIAILCNEGTETEILSTGPELFVEFVANSDLPGQGFRASFQFQQAIDNSVELQRHQRPPAVQTITSDNEPSASETHDVAKQHKDFELDETERKKEKSQNCKNVIKSPVQNILNVCSGICYMCTQTGGQ
ncbi:hypothetical protein WA026_014493 [Henosepilachna vigintioctopunctata]